MTGVCVSDELLHFRILNTFVNYGRKKIQILFEKIENICNLKKNPKFITHTLLKAIKGSANPTFSIEQLWKTPEERKLSNVDKIEFNFLFDHLDKLRDLVSLYPLALSEIESYLSVFQTVDYSTFQSLLVEILNEKLNLNLDEVDKKIIIENRNKLTLLLENNYFVLPKEKVKYTNDKMVNLLF